MKKKQLKLSDKERRRRSKVAKRNRSRGKSVQSKMAKNFGFQNVGGLGQQDGRDSFWSAEFKGLMDFEGEHFMRQAERNCPEGKTPLVAVHSVGQTYESDIVMVRFDVWKKVVKPDLLRDPRETKRREVKRKEREEKIKSVEERKLLHLN